MGASTDTNPTVRVVPATHGCSWFMQVMAGWAQHTDNNREQRTALMQVIHAAQNRSTHMVRNQRG